MNILNFHPPVWIRKLTVNSNIYRELTSMLRTHVLNNRHYIKTVSSTNSTLPSIIYMADGRAPHGGLGDRIWGMVFTYYMSKKLERKFYINFTSPFRIDKFLEPNKYDWRLGEDILKYDGDSRAFYYGECKAPLNLGNLTNRLRKMKINQIHFYNNLHSVEDFANLFDELFKPTAYLQRSIDLAYKTINLSPKSNYVSATFRFQNIFGDFPETNFKPINTDRRLSIMSDCHKALQHIYEEENKPVLVTSDSITFLKSLKDFNYVYCLANPIAHPESPKQAASDDCYVKSFIDLYMLAGADTLYSIYTDEMYKDSQFAKTAAIIGHKVHKDYFI